MDWEPSGISRRVRKSSARADHSSILCKVHPAQQGTEAGLVAEWVIMLCDCHAHNEWVVFFHRAFKPVARLLCAVECQIDFCDVLRCYVFSLTAVLQLCDEFLGFPVVPTTGICRTK